MLLSAVLISAPAEGARAGQAPVAAPTPSPAGSSPPHGVAFDIGTQPLTSAVEAYAAATGVQVLYDRPAGVRINSPGVRGVFTPNEALDRLLVGTGLQARFTDPSDVLLSPAASTPDGPSAGEPPPNLPRLVLDAIKVRGEVTVGSDAPPPLHDFGAYALLVRTAVQQTLTKDPKLSTDAYAVQLDLWIGRQGRIDRVALLGSSGDGHRDQAIGSALAGLRLDQAPPEGLEQPLRVRVTVRRP